MTTHAALLSALATRPPAPRPLPGELGAQPAPLRPPRPGPPMAQQNPDAMRYLQQYNALSGFNTGFAQKRVPLLVAMLAHHYGIDVNNPQQNPYMAVTS